MRALAVITISAVIATGLASLFMKLPVNSQSAFRELLRRLFELAKLLAGGGIRDEAAQAALTTREIFLSVWFLAFVPALFACGYITHQYWR
jgi:hypothetical protein